MDWKEKRSSEISKLFECIEQRFGTNELLVKSKCRKKELVLAKKYITNILFELFKEDKMTHQDISEVVCLNRCSFIHNRKQHLNFYERYKDYKEDYDNLKEKFENMLK